MKIHPRGTELFYAERQTEDEQTDRQTDRQTDMMKIIVTSCNFANTPKNSVPTSQRTYLFQL